MRSSQKMRIAYLMRHDISKNDGVTKKILDQVTYWKNAGHQVEVFYHTPKKCHSILDELKGTIKEDSFHF